MRTWQRRDCRSTSPVPLRRFGLSRKGGATSRRRRSGWWRRKPPAGCSRWSSFLLLSLVRPLALVFVNGGGRLSGSHSPHLGSRRTRLRRNCAHRHRLHTIGLETFGAAVDLVVDLTTDREGLRPQNGRSALRGQARRRSGCRARSAMQIGRTSASRPGGRVRTCQDPWPPSMTPVTT